MGDGEGLGGGDGEGVGVGDGLGVGVGVGVEAVALCSTLIASAMTTPLDELFPASRVMVFVPASNGKVPINTQL